MKICSLSITKKILQLLIFLLLYGIGSYAQRKKAIIVLTYDDALMSQLNIAIPQLDSAHLHGTFFLDGNVNSSNIFRWINAGKDGHELANHTLYHPCLIRPGEKGNQVNNSANYSLFSIVREIRMMNTLLTAMDGRILHTYAYPCTETAVGGADYVDTLRRNGIVKYARMGGDSTAVVTDFFTLDPLLVPSWAVTGKITGADLISFVRKAEYSGGLGIFMFHGIGGDYITTTARAHRELLAYLSSHQNTVQVMTFQQAMDYISAAHQLAGNFAYR